MPWLLSHRANATLLLANSGVVFLQSGKSPEIRQKTPVQSTPQADPSVPQVAGTWEKVDAPQDAAPSHGLAAEAGAKALAREGERALMPISTTNLALARRFGLEWIAALPIGGYPKKPSDGRMLARTKRCAHRKRRPVGRDLKPPPTGSLLETLDRLCPKPRLDRHFGSVLEHLMGPIHEAGIARPGEGVLSQVKAR